MTAYIVRRLLYALPILIGVNALTFVLFFVVNSPDDMARMHLGNKRVTEQAIESWKQEHGYEKPLLLNREAQGMAMFTVAKGGAMYEATLGGQKFKYKPL